LLGAPATTSSQWRARLQFVQGGATAESQPSA
jgi:hypothetical protein